MLPELCSTIALDGSMELIDYTRRTTRQLDDIRRFTLRHEILGDVLAWLQSVSSPDRLRDVLSRIVVQDEFSIDVVIPWVDGLVLVYDTT
jgi:hypothetical protein